MNENAKSSKSKKVLSATVAVAMIAVMLLSGTLAYFYSAKATNTLEDGVKEAFAHDDLVKVDSTTWDKDVYVENTGTKDLYVRVKLQERLTKDGEAVTTDTVTHIPQAASAADFKPGVGTAEMDVTDTDDTTNNIHDYFEWQMGGQGKTYLSATSAQYEVNTTPTTGAGTNASPKLEIVNGVAYDRSGSPYTRTDDMDTEHLQTWAEGATCEVISMDDYLAMSMEEKENFYGWVADTATEGKRGGWFYWSQKLPKNEATGLLLNKVSVKGISDYTYDIDIQFQVVDDWDIGLWTTKTQDEDENGNAGLNGFASPNALILLAFAQQNEMNPIYRCYQKLNLAQSNSNDLAAEAYSQAIKHFSAYGNDSVAGKDYEKSGDDLMDSTEADLTEPLIYLDKSNPADVKVHPEGMDETLASWFIGKYGSIDGTNESVSVGEALTIRSIDLYEGRYAPHIRSLKGITSSNFPNLTEIGLSNVTGLTSFDLGVLKEETSEGGELVKTYDTALMNQVVKLSIRGFSCAEIDLQGWTNLRYFDVRTNQNLTNINLGDANRIPTSVKYFCLMDLPNLNEAPLISAASSSLRVMYISRVSDIALKSILEQLDSASENFTKLKNMSFTRYMGTEEAPVTSEFTMDGDLADGLNLSCVPNLVGLAITDIPVAKINFAASAFADYTGCPMDEFESNILRTFMKLTSTKMEKVNIESFGGFKDDGVSIKESNLIKTVSRRYDQQPFTDYPVGGEGSPKIVWERVKQSNGSYKYYKHVDGVLDASATTSTQPSGVEF